MAKNKRQKTRKKRFTIRVNPFVLAVGGWIAYSALGVNHRLPLSKAIQADRKTFVGRTTGMISYYVDQSASGRPLVLIHSINAAASAYEMRPLFEHYSANRPVYAIDLPGFGFSERSSRVYSQPLYTQAVIDLLERVGEPADVIALSLGSEFAAHAAHQRPELFHSLAFISPSGFTPRGNKRTTQQATDNNTSDLLYRLFAFPLWSQAFYDLLATRFSIHFFLQQSFEGQVDKGLEDYCYATGHQPNARRAPLYFVSGKLFTKSVRQKVYEHLTLPVLVIYDRDSYVSFEELPEVIASHPNWQAARIIPTKGLPQFKKLDETVQALDGFWKEEK